MRTDGFGGATASIALVGNPNCGKTALFNLLTGSNQKVANYAGVTVEKKEGFFVTTNGRRLRVVDLPGTYGLDSDTPDEQVTLDALSGRLGADQAPDMVVCVVDATNLRQHLRLVLGLQRMGIPMIVALNMCDMAERAGISLDAARLSQELGVPVIKTVAIRKSGIADLMSAFEACALSDGSQTYALQQYSTEQIIRDHDEVQRIIRVLGIDHANALKTTDQIDRVVLHPIVGPLLLLSCLFLVFQAVFSWAQPLMDLIDGSVTFLGEVLQRNLPDTLMRSLLVDGVITGVGSVLIFLPQIVILFFFILVLEESGYLPRAAFLLDRLMGGVGLSGRSFIPLLSSFACAIPGIMATRTIQDPRDRLTTILIAPLMTCSARLPVYTLIIAAVVPNRIVLSGFNLQGLVLFLLYVSGIIAALLVAWLIKRTAFRHSVQGLMMELPAYHLPHVRNIAIGLLQRIRIFLVRVGSIILALMVLLWFLSTFPMPPPNATGPAIEYSFAGQLGALLAKIFAPIGFNWQIAIALVPGLAAREVAVGALATVYALSGGDSEVQVALQQVIAQTWSLATSLSFLVWYVFAPQCLSTLAAVKRETNSWRYPLIMAGYLFLLAYMASLLTYRITLSISGA